MTGSSKNKKILGEALALIVRKSTRYHSYKWIVFLLSPYKGL